VGSQGLDPLKVLLHFLSGLFPEPVSFLRQLASILDPLGQAMNNRLQLLNQESFGFHGGLLSSAWKQRLRLSCRSRTGDNGAIFESNIKSDRHQAWR
jgi:hypothetical protein